MWPILHKQKKRNYSAGQARIPEPFTDDEERPMNGGNFFSQGWGNQHGGDADFEENNEEEDYVEEKGDYEDSDTEIDELIQKVEKDKIKLRNNQQKGNYGEMKMDQYFRGQGYKRISVYKVTSLNDEGHQGIDGVYYNEAEEPPYVVAEAKYGSSRLGRAKDGKQMGKRWIKNRLKDAVEEKEKKEILKKGYQRCLFRTNKDGKYRCDELYD